MSNHKNLIWFNKEGDYLNFRYEPTTDRFEGNILFHENSTDTFKTYGLYMFEKIQSFEYELPGELTLDKFQLFNEYGIDIYGSKYQLEKIDKIEPVNNISTYYSKWIYGIDFEKKFPIGTHLVFNSSVMEFINQSQTYVVVSSKKNAVMILSSMDNATFESAYAITYNDPNTYNNLYISGINAIGVYNYIDSSYNNNLSNWSEPKFYDKYYVGRKLNLINTDKNKNENSRFKQKIVTISDDSLNDTVYFEYSVNTNVLPNQSKLIIELNTKTDLPLVYTGQLIVSTYSITFVNDVVPSIMKPGQSFKINNSINNTSEYTVAFIPEFVSNNQYYFYATNSIVMWNGRVYKCIQAYTQSGVEPGNSEYWTAAVGLSSGYEIDPDNTSYWQLSSYIPVVEQMVPESILYSQIYLTTDKLYFEQLYTQSATVTLASAAEKYSDEFKLFNIDLYFEKNKLKADLIYPTNYAIVNYYHTQVGHTYSIGNVKQINEKVVRVEEQLNTELNYNISENYDYNIVFTDIDEYGIVIIINKMVYQEEISWVYSGMNIDMEITIDKTLRNWLQRHYARLFTLGIIAELQYIGPFTSIFYNSIKLRTEYPNVPIDFDVIVGSNANFYIEHSRVLFNDMGGYFGVKINNRDYSISASFSGATVSIPNTLKAWHDEYSEILEEYGIYVTNINNLLKFDVKKQYTRLDYSFTIGKSTLPGLPGYTITKKMKGNVGMIITSNETKLPPSSNGSFIDAGFSTGMVYSVNNTLYPLNNREYVILYLDNNTLNMSYEGPFWGLTDSACSSSPFVNIAFNIGFGQTGCSVSTGLISSEVGGSFDLDYFNTTMFELFYNPNSYFINNYNLNSYPGSSNLVDIIYIQLSNSIYTLGDNIIVFDAYLAQYLTTIILPGNTQSIELEFNPINGYLYALSLNKFYVIDPILNTLIYSSILSWNASDMVINTFNGDIYISYSNTDRVDIFNSNNILVNSINSWGASSSVGAFNMVYNSFENDIYVITNDSSDIVLRIDGATRTLQTTYNIPGLSNMSVSQYNIYYEPFNESIYVWGSASLYKIDNSLIIPISNISTQAFNDIIFNNLTGQIYISDSSNQLIKLDLNTNNTLFNSSISNYGHIQLNQYDGDIYISSKNTNSVIVVNPINGSVKHTAPMSAPTDEIIYNPERKSIWTIQPSTSTIVEVKVELNSYINIYNVPNKTVDGYNYGTLDPNYKKRQDLWLKTREYIRRPRENFNDEPRVKYYYKWLTDNVPEIFLYDISGQQLATAGSYSYIGPKPLEGDIFLNKAPNRDIKRVSDPKAQQTVFDRLYYSLEYINEEVTDIFLDPEPIQTFIGFNSTEEGTLRSVLQLFKREDIIFDIQSSNLVNDIITFTTKIDPITGDKIGEIKLNTLSTSLFITDLFNKKRGLKPGQLLRIDVYDRTNKKKQYISKNTGKIFRIKEVYNRTIVIDFLNKKDSLIEESTIIHNYPRFGQITYLGVRFTVVDREIARFNVIGQTEEEDIRFKIELSNVGKNIGSDEVFIFKEYDIYEGGSDWSYLNKKRKEMLMQKHLIYPYIGSYKSIINAINFFGYNDLELNEYYRNINEDSDNFGKLFKVEIPDIFDNTVEGWKENDFIKHTFPNENFETTNLFNLTYKITDKKGTNVLIYTLREVQIKLQGLKYWLQRNIIPLTHKILDITGRADFVGIKTIVHRSYDIMIFNVNQSMCPVTFKLNEAYLMPVNSGSTQYNCVLDFYILDGASYSSNLSTFPLPSKSLLPDNYSINVKTYKTYQEWAPFKTYKIGDRVIYYDKLYESVIDNNKINNPRKYENVVKWGYPDNNPDFKYVVGQVYKYDRDYYVYTGIDILSSTSSTFSTVTPNKDPLNWLNITEWREIDYEPVQRFSEFRNISNLLPYNFTIDSNIDPFLVIEVTSDNGYGQVYRDKKKYEIRGLLDKRDEVTKLEPITPFKPISPVKKIL
jgi:hypothetical protein